MTGADVLAPEAQGLAPSRSRLEGRRILIVGAGQSRYPGEGEAPTGNGRAISVLCAREGADVALFDIDDRSVHDTAMLAEREGAKVHVSVGDASREPDVQRFVTDAAAALGGVDGLVLVVGTARAGDLDSISAEDWDWTFATNVRSHFLGLRHALRVLEPGSSIVLISSIAAYAPVHEMAAYHASKAALEGLKNVVAQQAAAQRIRVNIVAPGTIDTAASRHGASVSPAYRAAAEAGHPAIPLRRRGTAWEIAYPTVFLLSDEASFITGQSLLVDGGYVPLHR
jgi:NAD(P)-dependent dehydrogenase (short-subunit alcohol dehydrogenase family)